MRILLVNLTRFGDLLQTQPVVAGLRTQGHDVHLACLENFAGAAGLLDGPAGVRALSGAGLLAGLDRDWREALTTVRQWVEAVRAEFAPELTVNLTPTLASQLLCRLFAVPTRGFHLDEFGFGRYSGPWAGFLQAASLHRGSSPFNLVDLFRRVAECPAGPGEFRLRPGDPEQGRAVLARESAPASAKGYLALQLGASDDKRRWPVEHFFRLAASAHARHGLTPVLLGSVGERHLGHRFAALAKAAHLPHADLVGRTSLPELAAVLSRCTALVSNDTGTMHLAAGLSRPVLGIFLATAQPWDTGPYLEGALSLEPDMDCHPCAFGTACPHDHACRRRLEPEAAIRALDLLLDGGTTPVAGVRVWRAGFDAQGFMDLTSLSGHESADRTAWIRVQRHCYRHFLDRTIPDDAANPDIALSTETAVELLRILKDVANLLNLLNEQGTLLQRLPMPTMKAKFLTNWQRIQNILSGSPRLATLNRLWLTESEEAGGDMNRIQELIRQYRELIARLMVILESSAI